MGWLEDLLFKFRLTFDLSLQAMMLVLILKNFSIVKTAGIDHSLEYLTLLPIYNLFLGIAFS
ncbi:MAG: hypothetical protein EAZ09_03885 [Oscillatoriales cyanobacterium]|nr:MAG: hypothetical protein EAZ18_06005 [Oscillatoriales cyanobacterium]TAH24434.1 MAG: hypothetical protein EAZ09_03885 [Oscillatoriales cyanobacterium]